jgi:thioredoxin-related protein
METNCPNCDRLARELSELKRFSEALKESLETRTQMVETCSKQLAEAHEKLSELGVR